MTERPIVPYIRRDDISWWAGCKYEPMKWGEIYIRETSTSTRWGAVRKAKKLAREARRLRDKNVLGTYIVGKAR